MPRHLRAGLRGRGRALLAAPLLAGLLLAGCGAPAAPGAAGGVVRSEAPAAPLATVYRNATCTCCKGHERHLRDAGYRVRSVVVEDIGGVKRDLGVPEDLTSCHTTVVGGYFVEGHVPADVIGTLLDEQPAIAGIALAGMPAGAPGMPGEPEVLVVHAVDGDGVSVYAVR